MTSTESSAVPTPDGGCAPRVDAIGAPATRDPARCTGRQPRPGATVRAHCAVALRSPNSILANEVHTCRVMPVRWRAASI